MVTENGSSQNWDFERVADYYVRANIWRVKKTLYAVIMNSRSTAVCFVGLSPSYTQHLWLSPPLRQEKTDKELSLVCFEVTFRRSKPSAPYSQQWFFQTFLFLFWLTVCSLIFFYKMIIYYLTN